MLKSQLHMYMYAEGTPGGSIYWWINAKRAVPI